MQTGYGSKWILHPFLVAVYPVLALVAHNIEATDPRSVLRPLVLSLVLSALLFISFQRLLHNRHQAAVAVSLSLGFFFSYGHIYNAIEGADMLGAVIGRHRYLFPVFVLLFLIGLVLVVRRRTAWYAYTRPLNAIALFLLLFPIVQIALYGVRAYAVAASGSEKMPAGADLTAPATEPLPDIYYIILDGYARDDILAKNYQVDNRPFLRHLEGLGFFIAWCSQSNYAQTQLSLASSLNYDYLEALGENYQPGNESRVGLADLIQTSRVRSALEGLGYQVVAFETGYEATQLDDAEVFLSAHVDYGINDFENLLIRTTVGRVLSEGVAFLNLPPDWAARDQAHRERVLFAFEQLNQVPSIPGPKFVFAHIISPHWPHVFGPDGEPVHENADSVSGYRNQVLFVNSQIGPILEQIITDSERPPIIIVQGDHGSVIESPKQRMRILNAYYLPEEGNLHLYENVSPVNTFRVVFNQYFGAEMPILEDLSLYSVYEKPYEYEVIPEERQGCPTD